MSQSCGKASGLLVGLAFVAAATVQASENPAIERQYMKWVQQLGDPSFRVREQAASRLIAAGMGARDALLQGVENPDLEVRMNAHRVLVRSLQMDFDAKIAAFLADTDGSQASGLPGWDLFCRQVGASPEARQLFAQMIRTETELLEAMEAGRTDLAELLGKRVESFFSAVRDSGDPLTMSTASLATLLYVGSQCQEQAESRIVNRMCHLLLQRSTKQTLLNGAHPRLMKALLSHWVTHGNGQLFSSYALRLVLKYELQETGVALARQTLEQQESATSRVPYAAIVLGRFGTAADAACLLPHLDNETVFHTWSNRKLKKEPIRIQVRDAVLVMIVRLTGQDPEDYGFELLESDPETLYHIYTLGFLEDAQRDDAFQKWNRWASENDLTAVATRDEP